MTTNMPTVQEFDSARESLAAEAEILSTSIKELIELKPTCIDTGMSYRYENRDTCRKHVNLSICCYCRVEIHPEGCQCWHCCKN